MVKYYKFGTPTWHWHPRCWIMKTMPKLQSQVIIRSAKNRPTECLCEECRWLERHDDPNFNSKRKTREVE